MLHISNPWKFTFNTVRALLKGQEAWTQNKLDEALAALFKSELFAKESLKKLFKDVIWRGAEVVRRKKFE